MTLAKEKVIQLLEDCDNLEEKDPEWGYTALNIAALFNKISNVENLLLKGANIETKNRNEHTPLISASKNGHLEIVTLLLSHGAKLEEKDNIGSTALHVAVYHNHISVVEELLSSGADVHVIDHKGYSPLIYASQSGHKNIAETLIANGANVNSTSDSGLTAVHQAFRHNHLTLGKYLLENGADVNILPKNGNTPFINASGDGNIHAIRSLIKYGENINKQSKYGDSALMFASQVQESDILECLIDQGADLNLQNNDGDSALHFAVRHKVYSSIEYLLRSGAKTDLKNKYGKTVTDIVDEIGNVKIAKIFSKVDCHSEQKIDSEMKKTGIVKCVDLQNHQVQQLIKDIENVYTLSSPVRGRAVIINNLNFLPNRRGKHKVERKRARNQTERLQELFVELHFKTIVHKNLTKNEIVNTLKKEQKHDDQRSAEIFVLCILSSGDRGHFCGVAGLPLRVEDVCHLFDDVNCPLLQDIPKIILVQTTQNVDQRMMETASEKAEDFDVVMPMENMQDMCIATSSLPGHAGGDSDDSFINAFVEEITKSAHKEHILEMLEKVSKKGLQTDIQCTLKKKLYFFPGHVEDSFARDDTKKHFSKTQKSNLASTSGMKLLLLGEYLSGKTSLARTILTGKPYRAQLKNRTVVMETRIWQPLEDTSINVVDLGGHPSYYSTGHFFHTNSTNNCSLLCHEIYSKKYDLSFNWLKGVITRSPNSHFVPVLTKSDKITDLKTRYTLTRNFIDAILTMISQEIEQLKKTIEVASSTNEAKTDTFKHLLERYCILRDNIPRLVFVISCTIEGTESIDNLKKFILDLAQNPENKVDLKKEHQLLYSKIGKLGGHNKVITKKPFMPIKKCQSESSLHKVEHKEPGVLKMLQRKMQHLRKRSLDKVTMTMKKSPSKTESGNATGDSKIDAPHDRHLQYLEYADCLPVFEEILNSEGIQINEDMETQLNQALSCLHKHGLLLWFSGSDKLEKYVFNDISTFLEVLSSTFHHDVYEILQYHSFDTDAKSLFRHDELVFERELEKLKQQGHMSKQILKVLLLKSHSFVDEEFVFDLLEKLGISYRFVPEHDDAEYLFIPWYIDDKKIPDEIKHIQESITTCSANEISMQCQGIGNLPKTFFHYLCVKLSKHLMIGHSTQKQYIWGTGVYATIGGASMLIKYNENNTIDIYFKANIENGLENSWKFMRYIYDECQRLEKQWWPGLLWRIIFKCTHCRIFHIEPPFEFDLGECFRRIDAEFHPPTSVCKFTQLDSDFPTALIQQLPSDEKQSEKSLSLLKEYLKKHCPEKETLMDSVFQEHYAYLMDNINPEIRVELFSKKFISVRCNEELVRTEQYRGPTATVEAMIQELKQTLSEDTFPEFIQIFHGNGQTEVAERLDTTFKSLCETDNTSL